MNLADASADFEFVNADLVLHFHAMREDLGLAKLLLQIQEYVCNKDKPNTETPEVSEQNQNPTVVQ